MFIQRDQRKVDLILGDSASDKRVLKFSNRKEEFSGGIKKLCRESNLPFLKDLKTLNLYANEISDLQGIGLMSETPLEEVNLGNNKISSLPLEFGQLSSLRIVYLEDNEIDSFPLPLCQLPGLVELRLSGNLISQVPPSIANLHNLQILVSCN